MPRLPTVESLGQRPTSLSRQPVVPLNLQTSKAGIIEAESLSNLGSGIADLGDSMAKLNERDRILMNEARTEDATTQYLSELDRLTVDSEAGYRNKLGRNALADDFRKNYDELRSKTAKSIEEKLTSPEQVNAFRNRVMIADRSFNSGLTQHIAKQTDAFHDEVYKGVLDSERSRASANWREPGQVETSILRSFHAINIEATRKGMPENAVLMMRQAAESQIHGDIVQTMLMEGDDKAALQYFNGVKDRLSPESRITLGLRVQNSNTDGEAMRLAESVWSLAGPKSENDPVLFARIDEEIRKQSRDPKVVSGAISQVRAIAQAHNSQQQELSFSRKAAVLDAFNSGKSMQEIQRMQEFIEMDGASREELTTHMQNRGWTEQQRARSDAQWAEGQKAEAGFSTYWQLSDPKVISGMSEKEILSLEPRIGQKLVGDLMVQKRRISGSTNSVMAATIDDDMFKVAAEKAGLKPYAKSSSEQEKAYLGRLKNAVETLIDQKQREIGRELNREEKEVLMQREVDKKVIQEKGFDRTLPAGAVSMEERATIKVPIANVDSGWMQQAMNHMRSRGYASFKMDDAKLKRTYRSRLENAYAIRIAGGSEAEIDRALKGD